MPCRLLFVLAFSLTPLAALEVFLNRPFASSETPQATFYASSEGTLFIRIYQIRDLEGFLKNQGNAHTASEKNTRLMQPGYFLWRSAVENLEFALYQLARRYMRSDYREKLRNALGLERYAFPFRDRFPEFNLFAPLPYPVVKEDSIPVRTRHWRAIRHNLPQLSPGFYLLEVSQGRHIAHVPLVISDIVMVCKSSAYNVLVYAIDRRTGKPLDKGTVTAYSRRENHHEKRASFTLKDGIAYTEETGFFEKAENTLFVLESGPHLALSDVYAIEGTRRKFYSAIYTDRPIYRSGDTVEVRAVFVRRQAQAARGKAKYRINNPQGEMVHSGEGMLSAAGSIHFRFATTRLAPGHYTIQMELDGEKHYGSFVIEQYKKPETRALLETAKTTLLAGEDIELNLKAAYYSGEPLASAPAEITVERARIEYPWWYGLGWDDYYRESDYTPWEAVKDFSVTLDAQGAAKIRIATDSKASSDFHYRVRAQVKATNREETSATLRLRVYRAPLRLRLSQEQWYFATNSPIRFRITASDIFSENPFVATCTVVLYRQEWKNKSWQESKVAELSLKTNAEGVADGEFTPQPAGYYVLRVSAVHAGRTTSEELSTYVFSDSLVDAPVEKSITVTPQKKKYRIAETAEFAIRIPAQKKLPVLITLENDRIRSFRLLYPENNSFSHKVELKAELTPNFTFTATAVDPQSPGYYTGSSELVLPPEQRLLRLELTCDRSRYRPGEEAHVVVKTTDHAGRPVSAEFSLGVVDEAIYALREDGLQSLFLSLNPRLPHAVVSTSSLQFSFYGYGAERSLYALYRAQREAAAMAKGSREVRVRRDFRDTAYFASGKTGEDGLAHIAIRLPDNLTEWRLTAHAHTSAGLSGSERTRITVAKDFALRLA
ncbi:MAG: MG2 domain-containing protein, partial [Turneriella sp.]|nr:MG2 domain-containing protein [Turneriella sp.]